MRNRTLHDSLEHFAVEAAEQLAADTAAGAEVPFEVVEEPGTTASLYCYRPLTDRFIRERMTVLGRLPSASEAVQALERLSGLDSYLRRRGEERIPKSIRDRADAALRSFLAAVFDGMSEFEFEPERFEHAFTELEQAVYQERALAQVVAPVLGVELVSGDVPISDGLALVRADALADPPSEIARATGVRERGATLAMLAVEGRPDEPPPITTARMRFRRLITALRLFEPGGAALGPIGWARLDAMPWQLVPLAGSGRGRTRWTLEPDSEDELRAFCNLVARRAPRGGEVAWAISRFEMGRDRAAPFDALTDYLLALRALLEPEGPGSGRLAQRLAAICATPDEQAALAERVAHAVSLERAVIAGLAPAEPGVNEIVDELANHLRALLRDVVCGHLDSDLVAVADALLNEQALAGEPEPPLLPPEPPSGEVRMLRRRPVART
jgi:hypothetical protein